MSRKRGSLKSLTEFTDVIEGAWWIPVIPLLVVLVGFHDNDESDVWVARSLAAALAVWPAVACLRLRWDRSLNALLGSLDAFLLGFFPLFFFAFWVVIREGPLYAGFIDGAWLANVFLVVALVLGVGVGSVLGPRSVRLLHGASSAGRVPEAVVRSVFIPGRSRMILGTTLPAFTGVAATFAVLSDRFDSWLLLVVATTLHMLWIYLLGSWLVFRFLLWRRFGWRRVEIG
jgi:hypothetical protein